MYLNTTLRCLCLASLVFATTSQAQSAYPPGAQTGPVIEGFGPVMPVPEGAFALDNARHYKVSKDLSATSQAPETPNRNMDSLARFINMQARAGTPPENLEMALVVHGPAIKDLLTDEAYQARFGMPNPNAALIAELAKAGVTIYLCGQTMSARQFAVDELNPAVTIALSAMSAHVRLQSEGYTLIPF